MESYRENRKLKQGTMANISHCSPEEIQAIRLALKYKLNISCVLKSSIAIQTSQEALYWCRIHIVQDCTGTQHQDQKNRKKSKIRAILRDLPEYHVSPLLKLKNGFCSKRKKLEFMGIRSDRKASLHEWRR